ncbi:MAG TPA: gamma-glutamyltransferase [Phycisphaerae bacterium]|nr:gamma-glutamyltransferase [Phycisphaerae bacterium]
MVWKLWHVPVLAILPCALASGAPADDPSWIARSKTGMVASDSPGASRIGADVLKAGGNAFDAAVATSFALAAARPQSTGLGGGGFMVAYVAKENRFVALDFRETAPAGATAERFARLHAEKGDGPSPSVYGGNAAATPGLVAGLAEINQRFGIRSLAELVKPAVELAETGFVVDEHFRQACRGVLGDFEKWPTLKKHAKLLDIVLVNREPPAVGHKLKRPGLAKALGLIAEHGPAAVYDGPIGRAMVDAVQAAGGTLTMADLRAYRVREREPIHIRYVYSDYGIVSMPPPSSGGVCLVEILNILQACSLRSDIHPVEGRAHVLVEAMKHAFADRARWLGDPDFCNVPLERLMGRQYAADLAWRISPRETLDPARYGDVTPAPDDGGTSHFSVADRFGNIVALTETINGTFGSLVFAEPYGIILNNEMDDFVTVRGQANLYGLVHSEANLVGPGKRPLSSMSPTIILKDGKPFLVLGASGGPRIISSVLQVALGVMEGQSLQDAMTSLRLHHQWQPDEVFFDRQPPRELVEGLTQRGHKISAERKTGVVQAIQLLEDGTMVGASDPRKGGRPAGVP